MSRSKPSSNANRNFPSCSEIRAREAGGAWVRGRLFRRFWKRRNQKKFRQEIKDWTPEQRIERAKKIIHHLTQEMDAMLLRQATNDQVVYSDTVSSKIPVSNAAHAFNLLREDLHAYAVIRLLAVWDPADHNSLALPAAIELLDDDGVVQALERDVHDLYANSRPAVLNRTREEEEEAAVQEIIQQIQLREAVERSEKNTLMVREALDAAKKIKNEEVTKRLRTLRNFRFHSVEYLRGQKGSAPKMPKYGDEVGVLNSTVKIVEILYSAVNGTSYSLDEEVRELTEQRARELWENFSLDLPERIRLPRRSHSKSKSDGRT